MPSGLYRYDTNTIGKPSGAAGFGNVIFVRRASAGGECQLLMADGTGAGIFWRQRGSDEWSEWRQLYDSGNQLALGNTALQGRAALELGASATMGTTASRTSSSTGTVLQAKAMNDHRQSDDHDGRYPQRNNNLSDLVSAPQARTNLGLGGAATREVGEDSGNLMQVGAFGLGGVTPLFPGNTLDFSAGTMRTGLYRYDTSTIGKPSGAAGFGNVLFVRRASAGGESQLLMADGGGAGIFWRQRGTGDWSEWRQLYDSENQLSLGNTAALGRTALELGSAATRAVGESSGNVMQVGAGGVLSYAPPVTSAAEFNALRLSAFYAVNTTANTPFAGLGSGVSVFRNVNSGAQLHLPENAQNGMQWRTLSDSGWSGIRTIYDDANLSNAFPHAHGVNGWEKTPTGKIDQWGDTGLIQPGAWGEVILPTAFPNRFLDIQVTYMNSDGRPEAGNPFNVHILNRTRFRVFNGGTLVAGYRFRAIGD